MSYKLEKPFTDIQRADFICEHQGLNYYEDDNCVIMYLDSESVINGVAKDISDTDEYKAQVKKQEIQTAKSTRDSAINEITNAKLLDELQLDAGQITQAIYDARKTARLAQLAQVQSDFYTATGLTQPTTITA